MKVLVRGDCPAHPLQMLDLALRQYDEFLIPCLESGRDHLAYSEARNIQDVFADNLFNNSLPPTFLTDVEILYCRLGILKSAIKSGDQEAVRREREYVEAKKDWVGASIDALMSKYELEPVYLNY